MIDFNRIINQLKFHLLSSRINNDNKINLTKEEFPLNVDVSFEDSPIILVELFMIDR